MPTPVYVSNVTFGHFMTTSRVNGEYLRNQTSYIENRGRELEKYKDFPTVIGVNALVSTVSRHPSFGRVVSTYGHPGIFDHLIVNYICY